MNTLTTSEKNHTAHRNTYFNSPMDWVAAMDLLLAMGWTCLLYTSDAADE